MDKQYCDLDFNSYINFYHKIEQIDKICLSEKSLSYLQFTCTFSDEQLKTQQKLGLYITITGVICCLLYKFSVYWLTINLDLDLKVWDISTVTVADFSVQVEIPQTLWEKWIHNDKCCTSKQSVHSFKEMFTTEIEK